MIAAAIAPAARRARTRAAHPDFCVADRSGGVWAHHDPLRLYRWVASRNELLAAIEAGERAGRREPAAIA